MAQVSRTVQQYLAELEQANPVAEPALVSTTDPDALLATKGGGSVRMAYYDNYLIDTSQSSDSWKWKQRQRCFIRRQRPHEG